MLCDFVARDFRMCINSVVTEQSLTVEIEMLSHVIPGSSPQLYSINSAGANGWPRSTRAGEEA
jgi:hypothetical protein